jgi:hypothetical protein
LSPDLSKYEYKLRSSNPLATAIAAMIAIAPQAAADSPSNEFLSQATMLCPLKPNV